MSFRTLFDSLKPRRSRTSLQKTRRGARRRQPAASRLTFETLENRCMLTTFTVLNLADSGADSLRSAILAAEANPGPDVIDFAPAAQGTIALTSGQLDITDSLTVNGPGANALTVSGNDVSRVFGLAGNPTVSSALAATARAPLSSAKLPTWTA